MKTDFNQIF